MSIARAIHVLAVIVWIGGVAFVTTVLLPGVRRLESAQRAAALFQAIEKRFAWQARATVLVAGFSGFFMADRLELWSQFASPRFWWLGAMAAVWLAFAAILFLAEPFFLERWFDQRMREDPEGTLRLIQRLHWLLLALSAVTVLGAVAGSHGALSFG